MPSTPRRPDWALPERAATDEAAHATRRRFLRALGLGGLSAAGLALGGRELERAVASRGLPVQPPLPAPRNGAVPRAGRPPTAERHALRYNNFYEFGEDKRSVWRVARDFVLDPYSLVIDGLVRRPGAVPLETVEALGLEERVYRFRCVEAWAMTLPWTGVPLADVLALAEPEDGARYVALQSFHDPAQAPAQREGRWPFPYHEALRLDEALHPLAFVATGLYGKRLAPQSGAPLRVVLPWKYGYKGPKSVVRLTLTAERPRTFWNDLQPDEYSWLSNVDPHQPHPRWAQTHERLVGSGDRVPTAPYNGYAAQVAGLYA